MEQQETRQLTFHGEGAKLFGIYIVNILLTIVTFGLYYPWARAALLKYMYEESEFEGSRFTFHGTGKEMFIGFIKAIGIFVVLYCILLGGIATQKPTLMMIGLAVFYIGFLLLIPIAIHGALRYRASRSSWRGIHFGYRGDRKELLNTFIIGSIITLITFGIYGAWLIIELRKYIFKNLRFGNITFSYEGEGGAFFWLNIKGYFLTLLTLGIYAFWWVKDLFNYYVNNIRMYQGETRLAFRSTATAGGYFKLLIVNVLIIVLSLGLATPWAIVRTMQFVFSNIHIDGPLDVDAIIQTEADYTDATGEDLADMIDIGIV
ncbi:YjgN family protein [Dyadobacter sp. BHUBP1]|uniref:YjgN family protein n=1 Tax=Dyadobacter sp. BHUBP1 TaxID=3424178 RepID=UPI003D329170